MTIALLDEQTINQIAAGEVIEESASCIKELVENALDAHATFISIETKKGGLESIIVSDNGIGMDEESLALAIQRHATSKLRKVEDLHSLKTLGFRGEALASIAAISKMKISSRTKEQNLAIQIEVEKGMILEKKKIARTEGTTIEVRSLFYNTPARAAFQKGAAAQTQKIRSYFIELALFHLGVAFEWISDGKKNLAIAAHTSFEERVALLLGNTFANELLSIDFSYEEYHLKGFLGKTSAHKGNRSQQYLAIHGRVIESREISQAIHAAYGTRIPEKRYPPFVCHFFMPLDQIDVNVHPQKKEIRVRELAKIERFFVKALHSLFSIKETTKVFPTFPTFTPSPLQRSTIALKEEPKLIQPSLSIHIHKLLGSYAIIETDQLYLIDLAHATQFLREQEFSSVKKEYPTQKLLFPMTFHCSLSEAAFIELQLEKLHSFGFHIRLFGEGTFIVEAVPPHYDEQSTKELLASLGDEKKLLTQERFLEILSHRFVRREYTLEQAYAVTRALFTKEAPYYLTNGKSVIFSLTKENLQKLFL